MRSDRIESVGGGGRGTGGRGAAKGDGTSPGRGRLGVSTRGSELDSATKRSVTKQNNAAESYKIKDMDKLEKGQKYRAEQKLKKEAELKAKLKSADVKGQVKGAAKTLAAGATVVAAAASKKKAEAKPTPSAKPGSKKLTPEQAKLAAAVQRIGAIDRKKK